MKTACIRIGLAAGLLTAAGQAQAIDKSWNAANGSWNTANSWFLQGVPGVSDNVFVGNTIAAENASVSLGGNTTVASLTVTDGMRVVTNTHKLTVSGPTVLSGNNLSNNILYSSKVVVNQGAAATDFETASLTISDGAYLDLRDGAVARVNGLLDLQSDSSIYGDGVVNLTSNAAVAMRVDGSIQPGIDGLTINQLGTGRVDLDGSLVGGPLNITLSMADGTGYANLTINGDQLNDAFSEDIWLSANNFLAMNLTNGWTMEASADFWFFGSATHPGSAEVRGGLLTHHGGISTIGTEAWGRFECPVNLQPSAHAELGTDDVLQFVEATTFEGGTYTLGQGAILSTLGPTVVHGGTFTTASLVQADGAVYFNSPTTWNGTITVHGLVRQSDTATVTGPTTVNAADGALDMDGVTGDATWNIGNSLVVNARYIDAPENSVFGGTLNLGGTFASKLTVNLVPANSSWSLAGTMNLGGVADILSTRVEGSRFFVNAFGAVNVTGKVLVNADMTCLSNSIINIPASTAMLRTSRSTIIYPGTNFQGAGLLSNAAGGSLMLFDSVGLGGVGIANDGFFSIDFLAGSATTDRFICGNSAEWRIHVGGLQAGVQHDRLVVTGQAGATLGGEITVDHIDTGNGVFIPQIGDAITVLNARNGISGAFLSNPISHVGDLAIHWEVEYNAADVTLRVVSMETRCPADWNCDGFLDFFDYDAFVETFEGGEPPFCRTDADFNADGFVDFFDFDAFVLWFESGC